METIGVLVDTIRPFVGSAVVPAAPVVVLMLASGGRSGGER